MDNIISYVESEIMCEFQAYMSEGGIHDIIWS